MKAKFSNYYRSNSGNPVFVYEVTCTEEEKAKFQEAQGNYYRENEAGKPLFFSTRILSDNKNATINMLITTNGRVVADDADMMFAEEVQMRKAVAKEKAKIMARQALLGGLSRSQASVSTQAMPTPTAVEEVVEQTAAADNAVVTEPVVVEGAGGDNVPS